MLDPNSPFRAEMKIKVITDTLRSCLRLLPIAEDDKSHMSKFNSEIIPEVRSWLEKNKVVIRGAVGLLGNQALNDSEHNASFSCYFQYVDKLIKGILNSKFPAPNVDELHLRAAAGIIQVLDHPDNLAAIYATNDLLHEFDKSQLREEKANLSRDIWFLLDEVKTRREGNRKIAKRFRSGQMHQLVIWLMQKVDPGSSVEELWLTLLSEFDRFDPYVREIFSDKVLAHDGLKNRNTLKKAPYKLEFSEPFKSGSRKGEARYLTYQVFRTHVRQVLKM